MFSLDLKSLTLRLLSRLLCDPLLAGWDAVSGKAVGYFAG
jgi:hypothetical protein